jgi:dihydrofolate synthase/folylpolyglutamate synthase
MRYSTLEEWLNWQETLHPEEIKLGLDRVSQVLARLEFSQPNFIVVTVAGTNGKGSSVAMLQSILLEAGYRVGTYTSPHLQRYNERIQINGQAVDDDALCEAFERIDQARGEILLTYFEFGTLAAIDIFQRSGIDIAILEVGLGGRLDAVNILDADVALITSIDIDHEKWLGSDRESIAREKAGILRAGKVAVCADPDTPRALVEMAQQLGATLYCLGRDFKIEMVPDGWYWQGVNGQKQLLPRPALIGDFQINNAAGTLSVLEQLQENFPELGSPGDEVIRRGLSKVSLPGRFQVIDDQPVKILDVAHNPQGAKVLAENLARFPCSGQTRAVFAMMADKDIPAVIETMSGLVDSWYLASLPVPRAATARQLDDFLGGQKTQIFDDVRVALRTAVNDSDPDDRIVVFGSFYTVAAALLQTV